MNLEERVAKLQKTMDRVMQMQNKINLDNFKYVQELATTVKLLDIAQLDAQFLGHPNPEPQAPSSTGEQSPS